MTYGQPPLVSVTSEPRPRVEQTVQYSVEQRPVISVKAEPKSRVEPPTDNKERPIDRRPVRTGIDESDTGVEKPMGGSMQPLISIEQQPVISVTADPSIRVERQPVVTIHRQPRFTTVQHPTRIHTEEQPKYVIRRHSSEPSISIELQQPAEQKKFESQQLQQGYGAEGRQPGIRMEPSRPAYMTTRQEPGHGGPVSYTMVVEPEPASYTTVEREPASYTTVEREPASYTTVEREPASYTYSRMEPEYTVERAEEREPTFHKERSFTIAEERKYR